MQVFSHEPHPEAWDVYHRGTTVVHPAQWSFPGPEEAVPALPGPHGVHRWGGHDWHQGVPVPVQAEEVELQHGGWLLCFRTSHADRWAWHYDLRSILACTHTQRAIFPYSSNRVWVPFSSAMRCKRSPPPHHHHPCNPPLRALGVEVLGEPLSFSNAALQWHGLGRSGLSVWSLAPKANKTSPVRRRGAAEECCFTHTLFMGPRLARLAIKWAFLNHPRGQVTCVYLWGEFGYCGSSLK